MRITTRTLRDTHRILALRDELGLVAEDETLVALAERALSDGDKPVALFRWMLRNPESWAWLDEQDRARARARIDKHLRRRARPESGRRTRIDSVAFALRRPHRAFQPPPPSTGWQAEATEIARRHDERLLGRRRLEWWQQAVRLVLVAGTLWWLIF